ncbi:MAG: alpha/beta hydrolase [Anaerolineae bacterium]|nr:alpha/beta hydrolase [Gloeobacterales cyanobacterium ES-bin-313]
MLEVIGGLVALGLGYQSLASQWDRRRYPPIGRCLNGLHFQLAGSASPTVILDSGVGGSSLEWYKVLPGIAQFTQVVAYDRAGFGWSAPNSEPPTCAQNANALHALLQSAGIPGPYVLVGRALAGLNMRYFAQAFRSETAGLVLLDAAHEDQEEAILPVLKASGDKDLALARIVRWLTPFGLFRLAGQLGIVPRLHILENYPENIQAMGQASIYRSCFVDTLYREFAAFGESAKLIRKDRDLGDLPLVVVTAQRHLDARDFPADFPVEKCQLTWESLQADLAKLSTNSVHHIWPSGHYIAVDQPEMLVAAIRTVVEQVRNT